MKAALGVGAGACLLGALVSSRQEVVVIVESEAALEADPVMQPGGSLEYEVPSGPSSWALQALTPPQRPRLVDERPILSQLTTAAAANRSTLLQQHENFASAGKQAHVSGVESATAKMNNGVRYQPRGQMNAVPQHERFVVTQEEEEEEWWEPQRTETKPGDTDTGEVVLPGTPVAEPVCADADNRPVSDEEATKSDASSHTEVANKRNGATADSSRAQFSAPLLINTEDLTPFGPNPAPLESLIFPSISSEQRDTATALVRARGVLYDGVVTQPPASLADLVITKQGEFYRYGNYQGLENISQLSFERGADGALLTRYTKANLKPMTSYAQTPSLYDPFLSSGELSVGGSGSISHLASPALGFNMFSIGAKGAGTTNCWGEISTQGTYKEHCIVGQTFDVFAGISLTPGDFDIGLGIQGPLLQYSFTKYGLPEVSGDSIRSTGMGGSVALRPEFTIGLSQSGAGTGSSWVGGGPTVSNIRANRTELNDEAYKDIRWQSDLFRK